MSKTSRTYKKLRLKDFKLNTLLELTKAINSNCSKEQLFKMFEYVLRDQLGIGKVILFEFDGSRWHCTLKLGAKGSARQFDVSKDLMHLKEITLIESSPKAHLNSFDVVIPVYHKTKPLAYLLLGDLNEDELKISPIIKHMSFIQTLTNIIMVALENKRMARESIKQEGLKKELELASDMQKMLIPDRLPDDEFIQVSAIYKPHHKVGGDYYDLLHLNEEEILFCLADVSGKGIAAALLAANFQANLRALAFIQPDLTQLVRELNAKVMASARGERFITLFIAKYHIPSRTLTYINAGHNPPLLKQGEKIASLKKGCTVLGIFEELPFLNQGKLKLDRPAIFLGFTDGVVEEENKTGVPFGEGQVEAMLKACDTLSMFELNRMIMTAVNAHRGKQPLIDDIAIFSCKFK